MSMMCSCISMTWFRVSKKVFEFRFSFRIGSVVVIWCGRICLMFVRG